MILIKKLLSNNSVYVVTMFTRIHNPKNDQIITQIKSEVYFYVTGVICSKTIFNFKSQVKSLKSCDFRRS